MFKVVFAVARIDRANRESPIEAIASHTITDATIVPREGDRLVLRTAEQGSLHPASIKITSVASLATLDGFFVEAHIEGSFAQGDPLYLRERRIRQELSALGWTLLTNARPLDPGVDVDDYEGLENY
ncbi:hypothetical protein [uncultured Microbacterium sp.]|uniref:hypothetical protein n=1 Tax=uncultured Microbacterium sp. TaxID=191216 RepID=UPI002636AFC3|nr:hypothetical protein [uncultured Microbacterium sp.]